jgi:hypothetical protein
VGAVGVVVIDVDLKYVFEVAATTDQDPVQPHTPDGADETFGVGVGARRQYRCADHPHTPSIRQVGTPVAGRSRCLSWLGCGWRCAFLEQVREEHDDDADPDADEGEEHPLSLVGEVGRVG